MVLSSCSRGAPVVQSADGQLPLPAERAEAIAKEAYVYAYPMLENYRTMYVQAIDRSAKGYEGPFNALHRKTDLLGPEFKDVVRPNNDTLYAFAWLELRAQPVVITVPRVEDRYYSVQLIDLFTQNIGYFGTRATDGAAGKYLVAGPTWRGATPRNVTDVIRSDGAFVYCIIRVEVRGPPDLAAATASLERFHVTPMNVFLGRSRVPLATGITFPRYDAQKATSAGFVDYLSFLLAQVDMPESERPMMQRFAEIGIEPGVLSASLQIDAPTHDAVEAGVGRALVEISTIAQRLSDQDGVTVRANESWVGTVGLFGAPESMRSKPGVRATAAMIGLYGNDAEEAYYPVGNTDALGDDLDGAADRYVLHFEKDQLPPVEGFWSITMYSLPDQLLVANPIERYSLGDRSPVRYGRDGSLTIYVQHERPREEEISNWLPAPNGPFSLQMRMYLPKPEAITPPLYLPPLVERVR